MLRDNAKMYEEADMIVNMTNTKGFSWRQRLRHRIRAMLETTELKGIFDGHRAKGMSEAEIQKLSDDVVDSAEDLFIRSVVLAVSLFIVGGACANMVSSFLMLKKENRWGFLLFTFPDLQCTDMMAVSRR